MKEECCLEEESGLYHLGHFRNVLAQELARLDRWERPLSLARSKHFSSRL